MDYFWRPFLRKSVTEYVVKIDDGEEPVDCPSAQAAYFELSADAHPLVATFIGLSGAILAKCKLDPLDKFYCEFADLAKIHFSRIPIFTSGGYPKFAFLRPSGADYLQEYRTDLIATIDARASANESLDDLALRYKRRGAPTMVEFSSSDWMPYRDIFKNALKSSDMGSAVTDEEVASLNLAAGSSFAGASVFGTGFVDGENESLGGLDTQHGPLLQGEDGEIYAYYIQAEYQGSNQNRSYRQTSAPCFAFNRKMPVLTKPTLIMDLQPVSKILATNVSTSSATLEAPTLEETVEQTQELYFKTDNPFNKSIRFALRSERSKLLDIDEPEPIWQLSLPSSLQSQSRPVEFLDLMRVERATATAEIAFIDSKVWTEAKSLDFWDRESAVTLTRKRPTRFEYNGLTAPLSGARIDANGEQLFASFAPKGDWIADRVARYLGGRVQVLENRVGVARTKIETRVLETISLGGQLWAFEVEGSIGEVEKSRLLGGALEVGELSAEITGFSQAQSGNPICEIYLFDECSEFELPQSGTQALLLEDIGSPRLWRVIATTAILTDGTLEKYELEDNYEVHRPELGNRVLQFTTRNTVTWNNEVLEGSLGRRVAVPLLLPPPEIPNLCFDFDEIGKDYFGRSVFRVTAGACEEFDSSYQQSMSLAGGRFDDVAGFAENARNGLWGAQPSLGRKVLFEVFGSTDDLSQHQDISVAVSNVRESDGATGLPKVWSKLNQGD
ncbi:hypothetical protein [Photobacterium halotolerans]|uniref:hypothetical protein n=1 Tax=Photobacterium halotolerans TaxID=265726 RepID=UPI0013730780|nr:hypothetical protein [Photobacterium halotolerans]NAW86916.1 hypothetical protein [Photobacterium halotolerans]